VVIIINTLKKVLYTKIVLKTYIMKKYFRKNALIGKNFSCGPNSRCENGSNNHANIKIGHNVEILGRLITKGSGKITIGSYTTIRFDTRIGAVNNIDIGKNVIISNNVVIYDNNNHPVSPSKRRKMTEQGFYGEQWDWSKSDDKPIIIEDNVWIGEYAVILKGVKIGRGSIVGMRAVVTKDVPKFSIVVGNPAKVVKSLEID